MAAVLELPDESPVTEVHIEGLALLKIVKHCQESLPQLSSGSLLGLAQDNGVLEITHCFPFPDSTDASKTTTASPADADGGGADENATSLIDGHEFQLEMMRMLREVNVDNNCVGWYQSMYLGSYSTHSLVENQLSYQTDLSPNAVVILYDPIQTSHGNLVLKCYRLTQNCIDIKTQNKNSFLDPKLIFEQLPIKITNSGLVQGFLYDVSDGKHGDYNLYDTTFDRLDLSTSPYLEKHLEFLCTWVDDLITEQHKFQYYTRSLSRNDKKFGRDKSGASAKKKDEELQLAWSANDAPRRMESLLISNQIRTYCDQMDKFAGGGFGKLYLAGGLQNKMTTAAAESK